MRTTFTISEIRPPQGNAKSGCITTTDNEKFWLWSTKLGLVKVGATYEADWDENNGFKNVKTVRQVASSDGPEPFRSGAHRPQGYEPLPADPLSKDEQIWVQGFVQAFIRSGEVSLDNFEDVVRRVRGVYKRNVGRPSMQRQMEAAE